MGNHTETVQLDYDPSQTSYEALLKLFWTEHDVVTPRSRQYMSAIFFHGPEQEDLARSTMAQRQKSLKKPIVTKILPFERFYDAEEYHQKYLLKQHPWLLYSIGIDPDEVTDSHVCARLNGYVSGFGNLKTFEQEFSKLELNEEQYKYVCKEGGKGKKAGC